MSVTIDLSRPLLGISSEIPDEVFVLTSGALHAFMVKNSVHGLQAYSCRHLATEMGKALSGHLRCKFDVNAVSFDAALDIAKAKPPARAVFLFHTLNEFETVFVK